MRTLQSVTLLCLDTRDPKSAILAMQKCMEQICFAEAVLLTHECFASDDSRIAVKTVQPLAGIDDYSRFMVKEIGRHFSTSHVLIVQWDGFIVNPAVWDDEFLKYDYIGAPWSDRRHAVGNGGFSLRSRKLADALQDSRVVELCPEDYAICDHYYDFLTKEYGIRFAPIEVASRFSCEMIEPTGITFGFHGIGTLHWVARGSLLQTLLSYIPPRAKLSQPARTLIKSLIQAGRGREALPLIKARLATGSPKQRLDAAKLFIKAWF